MKIQKLSIWICLFAAVLLFPFLPHTITQAAEAETRYCQGCQADIPLTDWESIGGDLQQSITTVSGKHYYLHSDLTGTPGDGILLQGAGCIDLNGHNIIAGSGCVAISCGKGTTNLMGNGTVTGSCTTASTGATIHTADGAIVHLYGGTYTKSDNNSAVYVGASCKVYMHEGAVIDTAGSFTTYPTAVFMEQSSGLFQMYGGTIIGGTTTGNGGSIRVSNGSFIMDGGTITGGQATRGGNIAVNNSGKLTVNDGTITSGTATDTYGGGNIYTNKRTVTVNGGLITLGVATANSYGGGNIGIYRATFKINGGVISNGSAISTTSCYGGGNIYAEGDIAKLIITDGTITGGTSNSNGGNIACRGGSLQLSGGTVSNSSITSSGANIYVYEATATITGGTVTDGSTTKNGGNIYCNRSTLSIQGGTITNGSSTADKRYGGNIYMLETTATITGGTISNGNAYYAGGNIACSDSTLNIEGGIITGGSTGSSGSGGGNLYITGTVATMTDGTISGGIAATGNGGNILANSDFVLTGGTISDGKAPRGGNIALRDGGVLTVNGGIISGGIANATYGGGNIYINKCVATINDGLITQGVAEGDSYGGGNIGNFKGTLNIHGGTISSGSATYASCRGGGNIYMEGEAAILNMTAGLLSDGYIADGNGHSVYAYSGSIYFGSNARVHTKNPETGGNMNVYLRTGSLESAGTLAGGLYVNAGSASITGGKYYSFYYKGSGSCTITGGVFRVNYKEYVPDNYRVLVIAASDEYKYTVVPVDQVPGAVLVDHAGKEVYSLDLLNEYNTTGYAYIKLYADMDLGDITDRELWVDINGKNLTVSGSGKLYAFDTANDTYDAAACGALINNGTAEVVQDVSAPNGNRYIAVANGTVSFHRLEMRLTEVALRPTQAGIYYKASYCCDEVLSSKVLKYGIALSAANMPGADFLTDEDVLYTEAAQPFQSGTQITSVGVFNILNDTLDAKTNTARSMTTVYANPYIQLDLNGTPLYMADSENADKEKSAADFTGIAYSLLDVIVALDTNYDRFDTTAQAAMDKFILTWKSAGLDWDFNNVGKSYTTELVLTNDQGYCMVCKKMVTWKALDQATYAEASYGVAADGDHVYLAEDITHTGTAGNGFLIAPAAQDQTVCLHLNGHNLTTTKNKALYGNAGILNVLGSGTVAGYADGAKYGSAVQISTSGAKGTVNLYSGTYRHATGSATGSYVVGIRNYGGIVNIYKDAHIDGTLLGKAIMTGTSNYVPSVVNLYSATVDGEVFLTGSTSKATTLLVEDTTVNGTVDINSSSTVKLRGATKISKLDVSYSSLVTLDELTDGAKIVVYASGQFTKENNNAKNYLKYFQPSRSSDTIVLEDNVLLCIADYTAELELEGDQAYCRACQKNVTWTPLANSDVLMTPASGAHIYLTDSVTYTDTEPFITTSGKFCLHLNGHDIVSTQAIALYNPQGALNVLGKGSVTGYSDDIATGAAVSVDNGATATLYSGTYVGNLTAVACGNGGGKLNLYPDVTCEGEYGVYTGSCATADTKLSINGSKITGETVLVTPSAQHTTTATITNAKIGTLKVNAGTDVTLTGRPQIEDLVVADETQLTLKNLLDGTSVKVSANGKFTAGNSSSRTWSGYFTAKDSGKWIVVQEKSLSCVERKSLPNGSKILVIGNSMIYYGKYVLDKGHVLPLTTRVNDKGYLYQVCTANGVDVSVTNFTFGGHTLRDFYSGKCAADRGHNGHNHLTDLTDRNYDYVIFQEGSEAADNTNILAECQPLMDLFLAGNPNTKFLFLVHSTIHSEDTAWRSSIKELDAHGVTVVDYGAIVEDLINGTVTAPGATQDFTKFSFTVNKSAKDGRHPNILSGYLAAQMTYCAMTGESAVGNDYSFWNDTTASTAFNINSYKSTYYSYDKTVPSNTNFEAIFASPEDMTALHKLIDLYLVEKSYRDY